MEGQKQHILQHLSSSFLFHGLDHQQLRDLTQKTRYYTYQIGQTLIEEEEINDRIIIIIQGLVKVYKLTSEGKEIFLSVEKNNNYLGVMDLEDKPASATIEALQPTHTLILHKKDLITMLGRNSFLWERMYKIILAKMEEIRELQSIRLGNNLHQRTYLVLKFLAQLSGKSQVILSQETIAGIVGATRPRVTETLQKLRKENKITLSPKKITVIS